MVELNKENLEELIELVKNEPYKETKPLFTTSGTLIFDINLPGLPAIVNNYFSVLSDATVLPAFI